MIRLTWLRGGALAAVAGVVIGLLVQIRPFMGFDLLLPLFAAASSDCINAESLPVR